MKARTGPWIACAAALPALLAMTDCRKVDKDATTPYGIVRPSLSPELRPGSFYLCNTVETQVSNQKSGPKPAGDDLTLQVYQQSQSADSSFLVVRGFHPYAMDPSQVGTEDPDTGTFFTCAGRVSGAASTSFDLPVSYRGETARNVRMRAVSTSQGTLVSLCQIQGTAQAFLLRSEDGAVVPSPSSDLACSLSSLGPGYAGAGVITAAAGGPNLQFQRYQLDRTGVLAADGSPVSVTVDGANFLGIQLVDEPAAGVPAAVATTVQSADLVYVRSDRPGAVTTPVQGSLLQVLRLPSGKLRIVTDTHAGDWDPDTTGGAAQYRPLPQVPAGHGPWVQGEDGTAISTQTRPNPDFARLDIPIDQQAASPGAPGYELRTIPTTPCRDPERCRAIGESYLLRVVTVHGERMGLYYFWPWISMEGFVGAELVLAPIDWTASPAADAGLPESGADATDDGPPADAGPESGPEAGKDAEGDAGVTLIADNLSSVTHLAANKGWVYLSGMIATGTGDVPGVARVPPNGGFASFLVNGVDKVTALTSDDQGSVYWANDTATNSVVQAWYSDTMTTQPLAQSAERVAAVAVRAGYVYWIAGRTLSRVSAQGGAIEEIFTDSGSLPWGALTLDSSGANAWVAVEANASPSTVTSIQINPMMASVSALIAGPLGLAWASEGLFVRDTAGLELWSTQTSTVTRSWPVQGSNGSLALDASSAYVIDSAGGILAVSRSSAASKALVAGTGITTLATDDTHVFWAEGSGPVRIKSTPSAAW